MRFRIWHRIAKDSHRPACSLFPVAPRQLALRRVQQHRAQDRPELAPGDKSLLRGVALPALPRNHLHHLLTIPVNHTLAGFGDKMQWQVTYESDLRTVFKTGRLARGEEIR